MTENRRDIIRRNIQRLSPFIILLLLFAAMSALNRDFLTVRSVINLMQQVATVGIVALGVMLVIITGGIDFSSGFGVAMIGMAAGSTFAMSAGTRSAWVLISVSLAAGALLGLANGLIVSGLKIKPFIATLGTMSIAQGMALLVGGGRMIPLRGEPVLWVGQGLLFGVVPVPFVIFVIVAVLMYIILNKTKLGIYAYAIGSNEEAVRQDGINIFKYKTLVYVIAGICTGIAAMITITRIAMATPGVSGTILLDAIAATVIGGTSVSGGRGTVSGTIAGAFTIVIIGSALTFLRIAPEMQDLFRGAVIFIAIGLDAYINRYSHRLGRRLM